MRSDGELIARVEHDPGALEELYRRHVGRITLFAARRCREPQDVADLVAATFVRVIESGSSFDPARGDVVPWMLGITSHLWADQGRRAYRERAVLARTIGDRALGDHDIALLEEQIDAVRESDAVGAALEELDPEQRDVLLLVGHDGLNSREASIALGISPTAFRMRLSRARRALQKKLELQATSNGTAPDREVDP